MAIAAVLGGASGARADIETLPTTSDQGCLDYVSGAVGMFQNNVAPDDITLDVPGPVIQVIVEWSGRWSTEPADAELDVTVSGADGTD